MGEMLTHTERAKGAQGIGKAIVRSPDATALTPTLAELGISKRGGGKLIHLYHLVNLNFPNMGVDSPFTFVKPELSEIGKLIHLARA